MFSGKILGIDYGNKTIGLAIFNVDFDFIYPYKILYREKENVLRKNIRELILIIKTEEIKNIVVGLPYVDTLKDNSQVLKVKKFIKMLKSKLLIEKIKINFYFQNEYLTTVEASEILKKNNIKTINQMKHIDSVAACVILGDFKERITNYEKE